MEDLIKALQIFLKYGNPKYPFYCADEVLQVHEYNISIFSDEDIEELEELSFYWDEDNECFSSSKYGS